MAQKTRTTYKARSLAALLGLGLLGIVFSTTNSTPVAAATSINLAPGLSVIQDLNLDCESAALAAAFSARNYSFNTGGLRLQNWIFNQLPKQSNAPLGDPYVGFVGNVNGNEGFGSGTGYGVYYGPIANVATNHGIHADPSLGWTAASLRTEIEEGNPIVIWIDFRSLASKSGYPVSTWKASDGRVVPYTFHEHAVTVLGESSAGTITLLDVSAGASSSGHQLTFTDAQMNAILSTFGGMGVAIGPVPTPPNPTPVISSLTPSTGPTTGNQKVTVSGANFATGMTATLGGTAVTPATISTSSFTFTTPAESAGYEQLQVKTTKGTSALTSSTGYIFAPLASYLPLAPFRLLDTRATTCHQCGPGPIGANQSRTLPVTGVSSIAGDSQIPTNATAVVINVTAIADPSGGLLTVYPTGTGLPRTSSLSFAPGQVVANLVTVALGQASTTDANREINIYNALGTVNVVVDVEGYFAPALSTDPSGEFHTISPLRVCDTRSHQSANPCNANGTNSSDNVLGPAQVVKLDVTGVPVGIGGAPASIPTDGTAGAAVLNLTGIGASTNTYLSVYPPDSSGTCATSSLSSNLNLPPGIALANRVIVPLGPATNGGPATDICVFNSAGSVNFALDATGWFGSPAGTSSLGAQFQAIGPTRICDTRSGSGTPCAGKPLTSGGTELVTVAGVAGLPAAGTPLAIIANLTAVSGTSGTFLFTYPADIPSRPTGSDLNVGSKQVLPNLIITGLSTSTTNPGDLYLYNALGSINAIIDVDGWFQ